MKNFSKILKDLMEEKGINQNQLAKLTGINQQKIRRWLKGQSKPRSDSLILLRNALNVSVNKLLGLE